MMEIIKAHGEVAAGNNKKGSNKGNGSFDPGDYDDILKNIQNRFKSMSQEFFLKPWF